MAYRRRYESAREIEIGERCGVGPLCLFSLTRALCGAFQGAVARAHLYTTHTSWVCSVREKMRRTRRMLLVCFYMCNWESRARTAHVLVSRVRRPCFAHLKVRAHSASAARRDGLPAFGSRETLFALNRGPRGPGFRADLSLTEKTVVLRTGCGLARAHTIW